MRSFLALKGRFGGCLVLASQLYLHYWSATVAQASAIPAAVDTSNWIGYDGKWSTISIRVGNPPQWVSVLPSTITSEVLVIGVDGCDGTMQCQTLRGGVFTSNVSSTFTTKGTYELGMNPSLGFNESGYYGLDTIALSDDVSEGSQVVGIVNGTEIWSGLLGLGIKDTTFTTGKTPSFLLSLQTEGAEQIPSPSYGYTAGASYQLKGVPASLVFGGYDENRFEPNDFYFSLDSNQQPVVDLQSISVDGWTDDNVNLFDSTDEGYFTVDSSTPFLWLPESAALKFENTFGLEYDESLQLYFYPNATQEKNVMQANMTFSFILTDLEDSTQSVNLFLPGAAFTSLSLTYGYPGLNVNSTSPSTPYFPVRKAANNTQYIIGRMFLQETYLIVDYLHNNFSISQAVFDPNALSNTSIVDMLTNYTSNSTQATQPSDQGHSLSTGAVAGIAVGIVCLVAIVLGTLIILCVRQHRTHKDRDNEAASHGILGRVFRSKSRNKINEMPAESIEKPVEVSDEDIKELPGTTDHKAELASDASPPYGFSDRKFQFGFGHDPQVPVELPSRTSTEFNRMTSPVDSSRMLLPRSPAAFSSSGISSQSLRASSQSFESSSLPVTPLTIAEAGHDSHGTSRELYPGPNDTVSPENSSQSPSRTLDGTSVPMRVSGEGLRAAKRFSWER